MVAVTAIASLLLMGAASVAGAATKPLVRVALEGDDQVALVNVRTGHVGYFSTSVSPHDLLFAPDGQLWVTDWNGGPPRLLQTRARPNAPLRTPGAPPRVHAGR